MKFILEAESEDKIAEILRSDGRWIHEQIMSDVKEGFEPNWRIE